MIMKEITLTPTDRGPFGMNHTVNPFLKGCTHVETYTKSEPSCGEDRTLVIFAFYPDPEKEST